MSVFVVLDHLPALLQAMQTYLEGCTCHLFRNDHDPDPEDNASNYDEANFHGYAFKSLDDWGLAFENPELLGEKDHEFLVWTKLPAGLSCLIFGYYILDADGNLLLAERDPEGPINMIAGGQTYVVRPRLTLRNTEG